jgi:two-component system KDP operon response regulator KdpE
MSARGDSVVNKSKIMIVDDDSQIRRVLRMLLAREQYECADVSSGEEALRKLHEFQPDLILLDLNMPGMGGIETCRAIRAMTDAAIIVLTVRTDESDKIQALDAGGDDFVSKPFAKDELLARIRAAFRRSPGASSNLKKVTVEDVEIDFEARRVRKGGKLVHLTPKEFDLLRYLFQHRGIPISHQVLLQDVWGPDYVEQRPLLRVFITSLRSKIETVPGKPRLILTEPWMGYRFAGAADQE